MRALVIAPGETLTTDDAVRLNAHCDFSIGCNLTCRTMRTDHLVVLDWQAAAEYRDDFEWAHAVGTQIWGMTDVSEMFQALGAKCVPTTGTMKEEGLNPKGFPVIHHGSSGHLAIGLAYALLTGPYKEIWIAGFTCTGKHNHGDHTGLCEQKARRAPLNMWRERHGWIARDAEKCGVTITDWTRGGAMACYPQGDWAWLLSL